MVDGFMVPWCPSQSLTSVAAIHCLVASLALKKARLDPAGEFLRYMPTEPSLANSNNKGMLSWRSGRSQPLSVYGREQ
jgi:hypothetical protein